MKKIVLPQPAQKYDHNDEKIRNREITEAFKSVTEKLYELEERIKALEP